MNVRTPSAVTIEFTGEEAKALRELVGWDITIPQLLRDKGAPNVDNIETLMNNLHMLLRKAGF